MPRRLVVRYLVCQTLMMNRARGGKREYDKGERRFKHVGIGATPYIEFDDRQPKRWVGKCPNTHSAQTCLNLVSEAIAAPKGDRDIDFEKTLYVVDKNGAIYEAQTSDAGRSYHGYPYRGKMSGSFLAELRNMAIAKGCLRAFEDWVREHIELHGS